MQSVQTESIQLSVLFSVQLCCLRHTESRVCLFCAESMTQAILIFHFHIFSSIVTQHKTQVPKGFTLGKHI